MRKKTVFKLIGRGVYTITEAGRLTGVPSRRIRRWTQGYSYDYGRERRFSPPIVGIGSDRRDGSPIIQFQDLIEIRFLQAFRQFGVSWKVIRVAAGKAKALLHQDNPFATKIFRTDGRHILADLITEELTDHRMADLVSDQLEWEQFVRPHLLGAGIEFNADDRPQRWWPLGRDRRVVIDPTRAFGAPIVHREGVQTYVLARAVAAEEGDVELVASWYGVSAEGVQDALEFERRLKAA